MGTLIDITGRTFGRLTVLSKSTKRDASGSVQWLCKCTCGTKKVISGASLRKGATVSCGCYATEALQKGFRDITGQKFNRLTAISISGKAPRGGYIWKFICDCGTTKDIESGPVIFGSIKSCGCLNTEVRTARFYKHGHSRTPEFKAWYGMLHRCTNKANKNWKHYGGRGISVCPRWSQFENFLADMGMRPSRKHSIERINNSDGYSPENCKWATSSEQSNNKRSNHIVEIDGARKTIAQWGAFSKVDPLLIANRLRRGWPGKDAVFTPPGRKRS